MTQPIRPSLSDAFSLGEPTFAKIVRNLAELDPNTIVEFGSGPSSVRLALAFPSAHIQSIESDATFLERTRGLARECAIGEERLTVALRPLRLRRIGGAIYESYAQGPFPSCIDAIVIDGPPHWTRRGREACLHDVVYDLRVGGRIYLDDYQRKDERRIVRNWKACYREAFRVSELAVGHGVCVLEKQSAVERHIPVQVVADSWLSHARRRVHQWAGWVARRALQRNVPRAPR